MVTASLASCFPTEFWDDPRWSVSGWTCVMRTFRYGHPEAVVSNPQPVLSALWQGGQVHYMARISTCRLVIVTTLVMWLASLFSSSSCISWYIRIIGEKEADINHQWLRLLQLEAPATMAQIDVQIVSIQRPWKMFS